MYWQQQSEENALESHNIFSWKCVKELSLLQFGLRPKKREGTKPRPSTKNWIKDLMSMAPPIRTRPRFPHSQFLPPGSFQKPLILIHQRADRTETTITENRSLGSQACLTQEAISHAMQGHPRRMGNGGEFQQNVVHWRTEWQTTSVFLP